MNFLLVYDIIFVLFLLFLQFLFLNLILLFSMYFFQLDDFLLLFILNCMLLSILASLEAWMVKNLPEMVETQV